MHYIDSSDVIEFLEKVALDASGVFAEFNGKKQKSYTPKMESDLNRTLRTDRNFRPNVGDVIYSGSGKYGDTGTFENTVRYGGHGKDSEHVKISGNGNKNYAPRNTTVSRENGRTLRNSPYQAVYESSPGGLRGEFKVPSSKDSAMNESGSVDISYR
jgi:hypothetical protein